MLILKTHKISKEDLKNIINFKNIIKIFYEQTFNNKYSIDELYKNLIKYQQFSFLKETLDELKTQIDNNVYAKNNFKQLLNIKKNKEKNLSDINKIVDILLKDITKIESINVDKIESETYKLSNDISKFIGSNNKELKLNLQKSGANSFFNGGKKVGFLESFDKIEWEILINKSDNEFNYTYLETPTINDSSDAWLYYLKNIDNEESEKSLKGSEISDYLKLKYGNEYKKLLKNIDSYLFDNNKKVLSVIQKSIQKFPELLDSIKYYEDSTSIVYRGIGFSDKNDSDRLKLLKKNNSSEDKYIACTISKRIAENFATKGQNETWQKLENKYKYGLLLTYKISSDSIILDTRIFGAVFGENEVVIDKSKSKLINVEQI